MATQYVLTVLISIIFSHLTTLCIVIQACINIGAALGAISGPLMIGALTRSNPHTGWRTFFVRVVQNPSISAY